jgi:PEP-CTERM motif
MTIRTWLASAAIAGGLAAPGVANATTVDLTISGSLDGHSYTGTLSLDVTGGQVTSGTGTLSILGFTNAPLAPITTSSPGNEGTPVGYRANDGTDYFNTDGLLFDVNTTTPVWGAYPLFAVWSNAPGDGYSAAFTGVVDGVEYYNIQGSAALSNVATSSSAVPEPSTWAMMLLGFAGLGYAGYRRARAGHARLAA